MASTTTKTAQKADKEKTAQKADKEKTAQKADKEKKQILEEAEAEDVQADQEAKSEDQSEGKPEPKVSIKGKHVDVVDALGNTVRTYSEELHGKDFLGKAKEFSEKNEHKGFKLKK